MVKKKPNWPAIADALAARIPATRLHPAAFARLRDAWRTGERIAVAFSGGADSLALLLLLRAHAPTPAARRRLLALHFNHRLRGAAANADARFCAKVCAALGVPLVSGEWVDCPARAIGRAGRASRVTAAATGTSTTGTATATGSVSEAAARDARHAFFDRELRRRRVNLLCLGHHQDDVAETLLMRLARGSGAAGLAAPRPVQLLAAGRVHLRPLLALPRAALAETLAAVGATWREDASNATDAHFRNRVRRHVLPAWIAAAGRDAAAGAALSRELLAEDDAALDHIAAQSVRIDADGRLHLPAPTEPAGPTPLPRAILRRALRRWLNHRAAGQHLSRQGFDTLLALAERGRPGRASLDAGRLIVLRRHCLSLEKHPARPRAKAGRAN